MLFYRYILPILILSLGISSFLYLKYSRVQQKVAQPTERVWQVEVISIQPQTLAPSLTLYGRIETPQRLKIIAPSYSVVTQLAVVEGQTVNQDQALVYLDQRDFLPKIQLKQAKIKELQAQIELEQLQHKANQATLKYEQNLLQLKANAVNRAKTLSTKKLGAESDLDQAKQQYQQQLVVLSQQQLNLAQHPARLQRLQAQLAQVQAELSQSQLALERSQIHAPFNGIVQSVEVSIGDQVNTGQILLYLYPIEQLEVRARIPTRYQWEIQQTLEQGKKLNAQGWLQEQVIPLTLDRLSGNSATQGIDGLFKIKQYHAILRLGSFLTIKLQRPKQSNVIALPYQALYGGHRVYKLVEDRIQAVTLSPLGDYYTEKGETLLLARSAELQANDKIVLTHLPHAISGLKVKVAPPDGSSNGS